MFRGGKEYTPKQIQEMLNLGAQNRAAPRPGQPVPPANYGASRFLLPVSQVEFQLTGLLEQLQKDPWPVSNDKRPLRCTGVAVSVAVGLLEVKKPLIGNSNPELMLFVHFSPHSLTAVAASCSLLLAPHQRAPA